MNFVVVFPTNTSLHDLNDISLKVTHRNFLVEIHFHMRCSVWHLLICTETYILTRYCTSRYPSAGAFSVRNGFHHRPLQCFPLILRCFSWPKMSLHVPRSTNDTFRKLAYKYFRILKICSTWLCADCDMTKWIFKTGLDLKRWRT